MRTYETIFIVHPDIVGDAYQQLTDKYRELLAQQNAVVHKFEDWGSRKLAYPIAKQSKGSYVVVQFDALPACLTELERRLRLDEGVLKYQSIHVEKITAAAPEAKPAEPVDDSPAEEDEADGEEDGEE